MKFKRVFCFCFIFIIMFVINCYGHPGRTDSNGGHWNRSTGTYHYHNGGSSTNKNTVRENEYPTDLKVYNLPNIMYIGDKIDLEYEVFPSNTYRNAVYTKSSDSSIIKASLDYGIIEAVGEGVATITLYTANNIKIERSIKVLPVEAEIIEIQKVVTGFFSDSYETVDMVDCKIGDKISLWIKFIPENTTINKDIEFVIEDETILEKDNSLNYSFIAKSAGEVELTAKYGNVSDSIKVIVNAIPAENVRIDQKIYSYTRFNYRKGSEIPFSATVNPENTTDKSIYWSVNNNNASVDKNGVLKCLKKGNVILTVTTENGLSDSVEIKIYRYTFFEKVKIFFIVNFVGVVFIILLRKILKRRRFN